MNYNQNNNATNNAKDFLKENGIDPKKINSEKANALFKNLSADDQKKIENLLNDKKALEDILKSDKAKAIMKLFGAK